MPWNLLPVAETRKTRVAWCRCWPPSPAHQNASRANAPERPARNGLLNLYRRSLQESFPFIALEVRIRPGEKLGVAAGGEVVHQTEEGHSGFIG